MMFMPCLFLPCSLYYWHENEASVSKKLKILLTCTYHVLPHYNLGYSSENVRTEDRGLKMYHRQTHFKGKFNMID